MKHLMYAALTLVSVGIFSVQAKVTVAPVFADNMVLQRELPVVVWGVADPQEEVIVSFAEQKVKTTADAKGEWKLRLSPLSASKENRTLTVAGKDNTLAIQNVLVGEVWLCSGQSNMAQPLWGNRIRYRDGKGAMMAALANYPLIRFSLMATHDFSTTPRTDYPMQWQALSPDNAATFSAVGFYYGVTLFQALDIPIGLVGSYWGGTRIEPWTPPCGFKSVPALQNIVDALGDLKPQTEGAKHLHQQPTVLYNRMIFPFVPYTLRGAIWYQGCSNRGDGDLYREKMNALLNGWKMVFENPSFKLYFAQLAPYTYGGSATALPEIWEAQQKFADQAPDVGMAVITDVGNLHDIHPADKETVGRRLALLALNRDYGFKGVKADSPTLKESQIVNNKFVLTFNHAESWYTPGEKPIKNFEVAGADGTFVEAKAEIKGATIEVSSDKVAEPKELRYMWNQTCEGNLYNEACLLPGAFRIQATQ